MAMMFMDTFADDPQRLHERVTASILREDCDQCPDPKQPVEYCQFLTLLFDVTKAQRLIANRAEKRGTIPARLISIDREQAEALGLPLTPPDQSGLLRIGARAINEAHLDHIPEDKRHEPGIIAPCIVAGQFTFALLDGAHRVTRAMRAGAETFPVYALPILDTYLCLGYDSIYARKLIRENASLLLVQPQRVRDLMKTFEVL